MLRGGPWPSLDQDPQAQGPEHRYPLLCDPPLLLPQLSKRNLGYQPGRELGAGWGG